MTGIVIDAEKCVGCRQCERACASAGIVVENRTARVTESCTLCGACVDACPVGAIELVRGGAAAQAEDLGTWRNVWVYCQLDASGAPLPVAFELLGRGRELACARGENLVALLAGTPAPGSAEALIAAGADEVLLCEDERLDRADASLEAELIAQLAQDLKPEIILYGATAFGRELAPQVAVRLETGLTADCTVLGISPETGLLEQTRPAFGGNLMATITCPAHRPQMATVRPGIFSAPEADPARTGRVTRVAPPAGEPRVRIIEKACAQAGPSIAEAERLIVLGRGIGSKKNLPLMRRLAELLDAEIGCTRPLVEAGWLEYPHQVGQTGVAVAPKLLVSIGVSGAIQHLAGIGGAETVVAINEDPEAPIFGAARYGAVGDCIEIVGALVEQLEKSRTEA